MVRESNVKNFMELIVVNCNIFILILVLLIGELFIKLLLFKLFNFIYV